MITPFEKLTKGGGKIIRQRFQQLTRPARFSSRIGLSSQLKSIHPSRIAAVFGPQTRDAESAFISIASEPAAGGIPLGKPVPACGRVKVCVVILHRAGRANPGQVSHRVLARMRRPKLVNRQRSWADGDWLWSRPALSTLFGQHYGGQVSFGSGHHPELATTTRFIDREELSAIAHG